MEDREDPHTRADDGRRMLGDCSAAEERSTSLLQEEVYLIPERGDARASSLTELFCTLIVLRVPRNDESKARYARWDRSVLCSVYS